MSRYVVFHYKPHLACFHCRKTFRRKLLGDISENANSESSIAKCPECRGFLADMGLDFKSPAKNDIKGWRHMEELYTVGITFHSCGWGGPGYIPRDRDALLTHLEKMKNLYIENLRNWINYIEPKSKEERELRKQKRNILYPPYELSRSKKEVSKNEVIDYWSQRVVKLETHIRELKGKDK